MNTRLLAAFCLALMGCGPNPEDQFRGCAGNLNQIRSAVEMYASDHQAARPPSLTSITPDYLRAVPTCPAAGSDTYSSGYLQAGQAYTLLCSGDHHQAAGIPPDFPQWHSSRGLVER